MKLIELHTARGRVWVNPEYISSLTTAGQGSAVFIANDQEPVMVWETPETILVKLQDNENLR